MAAAVDALADSDGLDETALGRLRQRVTAARESANAGLDESAEIALSALDQSRARLAELTSEDGAAVSLDAVLHGLRRTYRRGGAAGRLAAREPSTENLHAWRRRVKDLRHHAELLRDVDPATLKTVRRHARALSDLLSDDHDLAVLRDQLAPDDAAVAAAIDRRRAELQEDAFALGARLYARSPRKLMRRVGKSARKRTDWKPARVS
jgi:hypothetical protein